MAKSPSKSTSRPTRSAVKPVQVLSEVQRSRRPHPPPEGERVSSWMEYLEWVTQPPHAEWAFRGHANAGWQLISTLTRSLSKRRINPEWWLGQEERILRIFKRKAHHFLDGTPNEQDEFEWLALMQHHGAPTRLLDFTWSPYVAAFFALEGATGDAVVWAVNAKELGFISYSKKVRPTSERSNWVKVGEPGIMNRRLTAQSGTFVVPGRLDVAIDEMLGQYPDVSEILAKFVLPLEVRDTGLRELYRMNITQATLFPDLDGLARSMHLELEYDWDFHPSKLKIS